MFGKRWEMIKRGMAAALSVSLLAGAMSVSSSLPAAAASTKRVEVSSKGDVTINLDGREVWQAAAKAMQEANPASGDIAERIMAQTGSNGNPVVLEDDIYKMELPAKATKGLPTGLGMEMYISAGADDVAEDFAAPDADEAVALDVPAASASDMESAATGVAEKPVRDFFASSMFSLIKENDESAPAGGAQAAGGEGYELNGSEHIYFVLSNATDKDVNYTVKLGDLEILKTKVLKSHGDTTGVVGASVSNLIGVPASSSTMIRATDSDIEEDTETAELTDDVVAKVVRTTLKNFFVIYRSEETALGTRAMVVTTADMKFKSKDGGTFTTRGDKMVLAVRDIAKDSEEYRQAAATLQNNNVDHADFAAVDISFHKGGDDKDYEPSQGQIVNVRIETRALESFDPDSMSIQHHLDDGSLETVAGTTKKTVVEISDDAEDAVNSVSAVTEDGQTEISVEAQDDGNVYTFDEDANKAKMEQQLQKAGKESSFRMKVESGETALTNDIEKGAPKKKAAAAQTEVKKNSVTKTISTSVSNEGVKTEVQEEKGEGDIKVEDGKVVADFVVDSFSIYTIVGQGINTVEYLSADGATYEVSVDLTDVTNIPEGSVLEVEELSGDEAADYIEKAAKTLDEEIDELRYAKALDISIVYQNEEIQPNGKVGVEITLLDKDSDMDSEVVHFGKKTEVLKSVTNSRTVEFETTGFSVYVIVESEETKTNRYTYHFLTEIDEDGNASDFEFVNQAGETVTTQIIKNGESLIEIDPPVTGVDKPFTAWYVATKNNDGTYSLTNEQVVFDEPITVGQEDKDFYVAPFYGESIIVTFYDKPEGSENIHIVTKRVVPKIDGSASVKVDNISVPTTATTVLSGWTMNGTNYPLSSYPTITATDNVSLYPIFTEGHWLRFVGGEAGSGAEYVPAIFITANTTAEELSLLTCSTRDGFTFDGWYYGEQNSTTGVITYGDRVTNASGSVLNPAALLARGKTEDVTLYGKWNGKQVAYRVAIWYENADDEEYSFQSVSNKVGIAGTTTNETASAVNGFTAQTIEQQMIHGDGSTVVNIYYKRNIYNIEFYEYVGSWWNAHWEKIDALTITAKYGADIHDQWPGVKEGTQEYNASWYVTSSGGIFVVGIATMPAENTSYYEMNSSGNYLIDILMTQNVDGTRNFTEYVSRPWQGSISTRASAEDYNPIKGFRLNAYSENDARQIRGTDGGDPNAVYDSRFSRSIQIGSDYSRAPEVRRNGRNYRAMYFYYLRNTYDVVFEENGGTQTDDITDIYYEANIADSKAAEISALNAAYVKGQTQKHVPGEGDYIFQGWYDNSSFLGDEFNFDQAMPAGNITLYAKWERVYYLIEIDPNGGEITADGEVTYTWLQYGDKLHQYNIQRNYIEDPDGAYTYFNVKYPGNNNETITSTQRKAAYITDESSLTDGQIIWYDAEQKYSVATSDDYYSLVGWYDTKTNKVYDFDSIITGDTSIQARWRRSGTFDIWYNPVQLVEGVTISGIITNAQDAGYADQSATTILNTPSGITSDDNVTYVFKGWQVVDNFTDCNVLDSTFYVQGDDFLVDAAKSTDHKIFLQAVYQPAENDPNLVPVTNLVFDPNGGTGDRVEYESRQINEAFDLSTAPAYTRTGYELVGWSQSKNPSSNDTVFGTTDVIGTDNLEPTEDGKNILYAIWKRAVYEFTVTKELTGSVEYVNVPADGFTVTVKFEGEAEDLKLIKDSNDNNEEDGEYTFKLVVTDEGDTSSKKFTNVPAGLSYTVTETGQDSAFEVTYKVDEGTPGGTPARGTVTANTEVTITNNAPVITKTGLDLDTTAAKTALLSLFAFAMMCVLGFSLKRRYAFRR